MWWLPQFQDKLKFEEADDIQYELIKASNELQAYKQLLKQVSKAKLDFKFTEYELTRSAVYFRYRNMVVAKLPLTSSKVEFWSKPIKSKTSKEKRNEIQNYIKTEINELEDKLKNLQSVQQHVQKIKKPLKHATFIAKGRCRCGNSAIGFAEYYKNYKVILSCSKCEKNPVIKAMLLILEQLSTTR